MAEAKKNNSWHLVGEGHTIIDWHGKVHATCRRWRCPTRMYARVGRIPTTKKDATTRRKRRHRMRYKNATTPAELTRDGGTVRDTQ